MVTNPHIPERYAKALDCLPRNYDQALAHLLEEMGEAQQAIGKLFRFGPDNFDPRQLPPELRENQDVDVVTRMSHVETNEQHLLRELSDVEQTIRTFRKFVRDRTYRKEQTDRFGDE